MLVKRKKEISKKLYDMVVSDNLIYCEHPIIKYHVPDNKLPLIFNQCVLCGYGVYMPVAYETDDAYYVEYETSSSCD